MEGWYVQATEQEEITPMDIVEVLCLLDEEEQYEEEQKALENTMPFKLKIMFVDGVINGFFQVMQHGAKEITGAVFDVLLESPLCKGVDTDEE